MRLNITINIDVDDLNIDEVKIVPSSIRPAQAAMILMVMIINMRAKQLTKENTFLNFISSEFR